MRKILLIFALLCSVALSMSAQRCAVLEFKAGVGISQADVDGISAIFITYFRPAGYTMVERTQIDKAIDEQGFQRSKMTENQMVRIGQILNVSKIVVGDVNIVMGQYNVDARVINVESGTIAAAKGATFNGSSYRASMQNLAQNLASSIAITSGGSIYSQQSTSPQRRDKVEVIYGYLKIFPNEIGEFEAEPTSVIRQINNQVQYGYNNWRIPTNEELALIRANGYIGQNKYMTKESRQGMVLLVSDGDDYASIKAAIERQEREKQEEQARKEKEKKQKISQLIAQGVLVDLGLPSGTLWKNANEEGGLYTHKNAVSRFGFNHIPTREQWSELRKMCTWTWTGRGYTVESKNGQHIFLPETSGRACNGSWYDGAYYWSSTPSGCGYMCLRFNSKVILTDDNCECASFSIRLVY